MATPERTGRPGEWAATVRRVLSVAREKEVPILAAAFAHYALTTLVPFVLLAVIGLAEAGGLDELMHALEALTRVESRRLARLLRVLTNDIRGRRRAGALALAIMLWSSFRMFVAVDRAFTVVYGERTADSTTRRVVQAGNVFVTIMAAVGLLVAVWVALAVVLKGGQLVLAPFVVFAVFVVVFLPMFYFFSRGGTPLWNVLPGVVLTASFWAASGVVFRIYATGSLSVRLYGAIGGLLLLLTWLYLGGVAMMVGIVLNGVLYDAPELSPA